MAKVEITNSLERKVRKKFKKKSIKIFELMKSLEENPHKGKPLAKVGGFTIKELRYDNSFRFYFIIDRSNINVLSKEELVNLLIKFIKMSTKNNQQKTIDEIKKVLIKLGPEGFG